MRKFCSFVIGFLLSYESIFSKDVVLGLEDCLSIGLTNHYLLSTSKEKAKLFPLLEREKWRNYLPRVGIHYFGTNADNKNQIDSEYHDLRIQIQQMIYDGGDTDREIQKFKVQSLIHKEDWVSEFNLIQKEISLAYLELSKWSIFEILYEGHAFKINQEINRIQREFKLGFVSKKDLKLYEIKWKEWEDKKIRIQTSKQIAKANLIRLLGGAELGEFEIQTKYVFGFHWKKIPNKEESIEISSLSPIRKSRYQIEQAKIDEEARNEYWKPKVVLGGYLGKNTNDGLPVKNQVYGFSLGVQANLGSSSFNGSSLAGVQTEGTGIQRIPGFGPQYVGRGENLFQNGNLQLFDDFSQARKEFESKWNLKSAIAHDKYLNEKLSYELVAKQFKIQESLDLYKLNWEKYTQIYEYKRIKESEYALGHLSMLDYMKDEDELLSQLTKTIEAYLFFISQFLEYSHLTGQSLISNSNYDFLGKYEVSNWVEIFRDFSDHLNLNVDSKEPNLKNVYPYFLDK